MENINEIKEKLEKMRVEFAEKLNEKRLEKKKEWHLIEFFYDELMIYIDSIQEDIVLWRSYPSLYTLVPLVYFYTDLEGKILFNESFFQYATPFSNSCALVQQEDDWYIIDLKSKELIGFPKEIIPYSANGFEMGNLVIFNREKEHWGSCYYNRKDKVFEQDIPFIWDALEFTRNQDFVYVGMHDIYETPAIQEDYYESHLKYEKEYYAKLREALRKGYPTTTWEPPGKIADLPHNNISINFDCQTIRFTIFKLEKCFAYDLGKYQEILNLNEDDCYQKIIKRKRMLWPMRDSLWKRKEMKIDILYTISGLNSFGDYRWYIKDYNNEEFNNKGIIVDVGKMEDYKRILGKLKK